MVHAGSGSREPVRHWQALHFADPQELLVLGQVAEEEGFTGIALGDHLLLPASWESPYPYTADGRVAMSPLVDFPDPWVTFGALAMRTTRLKFTTWVYILPLRDVFTVAKSIATFDRLAPGRLLFGVGVGWLSEEFEATGLDFRQRGRRTDEMLEALGQLWTGAAVSYHGRHVDFDNVYLRPAPEHRIPICVGGHTRVALERAARHDGWYGLAVERSQLVAEIAEVQELRRRSGRAGDDFTIMVSVAPNTDHEECDALARLGVTDVVFSPPAPTLSLDEKVERLRTTIAEHATATH
jgi:probable F420-dependent oxidoreductase